VVVAAWLFARGRNRVSRSLSEPRLIGENSESSRGSYTLLIAPTSTTGSGDPPAVSSSQPLIHVGRAALPPSQPDSAIVADPADLSDAADAPAPQRLRPAPAPERIPHGLIPHLAHWFKQRVIRKLVADRGQLMETQEAARLKVLAVDERLSRIESQIQNQTQAYECRIEELTRELHSAKAENREIIQGRINQVKAEMEAARAQRRGAASH
jgi:hypothetical protein